MSSYTLTKGGHVINSRVFNRQGKGTGGSVLRKKGSSNLTEDGSKEGRYLPPHLQVNRRIIRVVASLELDVSIMLAFTFVFLLILSL